MEGYLKTSGSKSTDSYHVVARFGTSTAVKEGIKAGLGISVLSSRALDTELKTGIIKALRVKGLSMFRNFYLIRDRRRIASPLCQTMFDFLLTTSKEKVSL
jgi:DNA-binding transcriptional LysR family regulator